MIDATYEAKVGAENANPAAYLKIFGAVISLMVFLGIVGWGAKMILRDSAGAPVVRALNGPMRISPEDPGGVMASHQGLTVNEVASSQKKLPLEDRLRLAPRPISLQAEDQPITLLLASEALLKDASSLAPHLQVTVDSAAELPTKSINGKSIRKMLLIHDPASSKLDPEILKIKEDLSTGSSAVTLSNGSGPTQSLRPRTRSSVSIVSSVSKSIAVLPQLIYQGEPMAQLGAFGSQSFATQAWLNLSQRHGDYLTGKKHIILKAEVGGGTIYRLRVYGFSDLAAVRRLCKALNGRNAECYSVMMN